jgi:hypothetical protein
MFDNCVAYNKGSDSYNERLGLFRMLFDIRSEPDVIKCTKSTVSIKENGIWKQIFPEEFQAVNSVE